MLIKARRCPWNVLLQATPTLLLAFFGITLLSETSSLPAQILQPLLANPGKESPANLAAASPNVDMADSTNAMAALDDKHTLAFGDVVSFRIVEDEDDPKPLIVTDSGDLEVPYIGRFPAEKKTCKQLAFEIKAALEKKYYYQATVIIAVNSMAKSRGKVYLVGAVRGPGPEDLPSDETLTLSKAILRAGGFTDFADQHHVKITREHGPSNGKRVTKVTLVVDVGQIFDEGRTEKDVALTPDDLIYIPDRLIRF